MVYFICTRFVKIINVGFFIKALKCTINSKRLDKEYICSLSQKSYDVFYSICWMLKEFSVTTVLQSIVGSDDSLLLNPILDENMENTCTKDSIRNKSSKNIKSTIENEVYNSMNMKIPNDTCVDILNLDILNDNLDDTTENDAIKSNYVEILDNSLTFPEQKNENSSKNNIKNKIKHDKSQQKLKLSKKDEMLLQICNAIVQLREGHITDLIL